MARKFSDEERYKLIKLVGEYYIKTGASLRKIGKEFGISIPTVSSYIELYKQGHEDLEDQIDEIKESHKPSTIDDVEVRTRVVNVAKLCLKGYTMEEIANAWGVSVDVINDDLHSRLKKIKNVSEYFDLAEGENIVDMVNQALKEHSANSRKAK